MVDVEWMFQMLTFTLASVFLCMCASARPVYYSRVRAASEGGGGATVSVSVSWLGAVATGAGGSYRGLPNFCRNFWKPKMQITSKFLKKFQKPWPTPSGSLPPYAGGIWYGNWSRRGNYIINSFVRSVSFKFVL